MNAPAKLAATLSVLVSLGVAGGVAFGSRGTEAPPPPAASERFSHETLQQDGEMTQRMSVPGSPGAMERGRTPDDQLGHAGQSGFDGDLRAHQEQVDRMLARP